MRTDDWAHIFFQNGIFQVELRLFLDRLKAYSGTTFAHLHALASADWEYSNKAVRQKSLVVFTEEREKASEDNI